MDNAKIENGFVPDLGVIKTDNFSAMYPIINDYIMSNVELSESRDGKVRELLDVKTMLTNPYRRCVGGYKRNINIFFLLTEAMWIVLGRKDVKTLVNFNSNMKNFSDDGKSFHAPYGFRLRHWGVRTEDNFDEKLTVAQGTDQVLNAIKIFTENPNTRQVVMSIWNPDFDLGFKTKDIPCNDIIMLKIRNGQMITTVQNRSNDLHWGLPTNIFQFSFLTEVMAACLGVRLGTQTHNSQSLHIYEWNKVAETMKEEYEEEGAGHSLYDEYAVSREIDFNFSHEVPANRFREVEYMLSVIVENLNRLVDGGEENENEIEQLAMFSKWLYNSYQVLKIYVDYKHRIHVAKTDKEKDAIRLTSISEIELLAAEDTGMNKDWDVYVLAKNFFAARLSGGVLETSDFLGWL